MKNTTTFAGWLCVVLFAATGHSRAGIRPSFSLNHSTWHATDIVVASEGDTVDGTVSVLEVWKGRLAPGKVLSIPALARFAKKETRTVKPGWIPVPRDDKATPVVLSGRRMVLFLKRATPVAAKGKQPEPVRWAPTSLFGGMHVSVVWIERGKTYSFVQIMNPGPSMLTGGRRSEKEMKKSVSLIMQTQQALASIAAVADPRKRARDATKYVRSDDYRARQAAFGILAGCKTAAVPILRSLLADESNADRYGGIVDALAVAGGSALGQDFTDRVEKELTFWKARAPSLKVGWWNGTGLEWKDAVALRNRYSKILHVLYALRKMRHEGARKPVRAFRDYWRSLPQLEGKSGLSQMSETCDAVLKSLDEAKGSSNKRDAGDGR
ncbi:MAG TPA: hypothetical protein ENH62_13830 [Marinobacter sp.]|uniref:HEAT repeat domain-containing protein n=1 Tax=marine sediment metagenome TaxID=412755 RepID=A0A0F9EC01_9ZZZZ|nr:hypothetical protein [Marinobacter sp.]